MTHPHHPLFGQEFDLVMRGQNWREDRAWFHDRAGRLRSLPASWTDLVADHPFNVVAVQALAQQFYPGQFGALDPKETERKAWGFLGLEPAGTYWQALGK